MLKGKEQPDRRIHSAAGALRKTVRFVSKGEAENAVKAFLPNEAYRHL
jgi:hypothetical protein